MLENIELIHTDLLGRLFKKQYERYFDDGLVYVGIGKKPMDETIGSFLGYGMGLELKGMVKPENILIHVKRPFVFDALHLPKKYLGAVVKVGLIIESLPREFNVTDFADLDLVPYHLFWSPARYIAFVNRERERIKRKLGNKNLTDEKILDILVNGSFKEHIQICKDSEEYYNEVYN